MTNLFVKFNTSNISENDSNYHIVPGHSMPSQIIADIGCDGYPIRVCLPSSVLVGATGISFKVGGVGQNCCISDSGPLYSNIVTIPVNGA